MSQAVEPPNYKPTLNLPQTGFAMKANLIQNEPASLKRWAGLGGGVGLYALVRRLRAGAERFAFHDGPPYANGSIHLGHLMNKCLKDFVVRSRTMAGLDVAYVPGWDCHGLPIEHKVMTELVEGGKAQKLAGLEPDVARMAVRRECQKYAEKHVKLQSGQMKRLLTLADYEEPYLTMSPAYEGAVLEVLAGLVGAGLVYRALKPVHWSIANETALAEAELEYQDREDVSVYVDFEAAEASAVYAAFGIAEADRPGASPSFMIWTTTPWTLPANLAIAVSPEIRYALAKIDGNYAVVAEKLLGRVTEKAGSVDVEVIGLATGDRLIGLRYRHPFLTEAGGQSASPGASSPGTSSRGGPCWTLMAAGYVTTQDGTGLVHTAPGHGAEDYQTGQREGLPVYCPVLADGRYDASVPEWLRGMSIWEANERIVERLRESGHLFHAERYVHSYPHDWRSKTPVIFRCTEQWFVGVDIAYGGGGTLRSRALGAIGPRESEVEAGGGGGGGGDRVRFVPEWGRNRMRGMLESRPDWCISRQRAWGLPIPAFTGADGRPFMTASSVRAVARLFREKGSDAWFQMGPAELLAYYDPSSDPAAPAGLEVGGLRKGADILDVWFESGSSWNAVMRERFGAESCPVELYLEGSDQHRGWFQLSMLPALGVTGRPPFRALLTHGFCVDKEGKKLSKSAGHTIENLFERYGADVLRWWVSSAAYEGDVKVDDEFFSLAGESYRKVRNTLRFMLSNLYDARREELARLGPAPALSPEAWILSEFDLVRAEVLAGYGAYSFRRVHSALYEFCAGPLSGVYLALVKDRLYCDRPGSPRRRRTQAALLELTDGLCRLLAPILCHTADEAYRELPGVAGEPGACVHLETMPGPTGAVADPAWARAMALREEALRALDRAKAQRGIENPLDAGLTLPDPDGLLARLDADDLADLYGVSRAGLGLGAGVGGSATAVEVVDLRDQPRCDRSRKRHATVRRRSDGGMLSDRDAEAVGV